MPKVLCHRQNVEMSKQHMEIDFLLLPCDPGNGTWVQSLGFKCYFHICATLAPVGISCQASCCCSSQDSQLDKGDD